MIGILGGTFDPIHNGHLTIAELALKKLKLQQVEFIPCNTPAHRVEPVASPSQRLQMLKLALQNYPHFRVNSIEIERPGVSYAIQTLQALQGNDTLCFILGVDAFVQFDQWHNWQMILNYCHLIVINRPGFEFQLDDTLQDFYDQHKCDEVNQLQNTKHGLIYTLTIDPIDISATMIRTQLANHQPVSTLIPDVVMQYILHNNLYR